MSTTELAVRAEPLLPMDIDAAQQAMDAYQSLTSRLLVGEDWQGPPGKKGSFVKRRGWSKLATFYGVSTEIISEKVERDTEGNPVRASFVVRASHPNGRSEDGDGACSINEPRFKSPSGRQKTEHDIPATARTRARNRAIADLIGFGEVSAEEMDATGATEPDAVEVVPEWATLIGGDRVADVAQQLVRIIGTAGADEPADAVKQIGRQLRDVCGGIPACVALLVDRLHDSLPDPAEPVVEATDDTAGTEPTPDPETSAQ